MNKCFMTIDDVHIQEIIDAGPILSLDLQAESFKKIVALYNAVYWSLLFIREDQLNYTDVGEHIKRRLI